MDLALLSALSCSLIHNTNLISESQPSFCFADIISTTVPYWHLANIKDLRTFGVSRYPFN
jgi:hypothetical protein